jgi:hypothetical protein
MDKTMSVTRFWISICLSLFWMGALALARRIFSPELDPRWVLVAGILVFGFLMATIGRVQTGHSRRPRLQMAHRRPSRFRWAVGVVFFAFLFVKAIQFGMVALGAG